MPITAVDSDCRAASRRASCSTWLTVLAMRASGDVVVKVAPWRYEVQRGTDDVADAASELTSGRRRARSAPPRRTGALSRGCRRETRRGSRRFPPAGALPRANSSTHCRATRLGRPRSGRRLVGAAGVKKRRALMELAMKDMTLSLHRICPRRRSSEGPRTMLLSMDRLYTAFVSSTYVDLKLRAANGCRCSPTSKLCALGMEFFPSTGADQWHLILESIAAADFCVFIIGGRYGSVAPDTGMSWTHREYREAVRQGKPMVILIHRDLAQLPGGRVELSSDARTALEVFKAELQGAHGCRYFTDAAEILTGLYVSVAALKQNGSIEGWIPAGARPVAVQETDFDRTYELVESQHVYSRSTTRPETLDLVYTSRRVVRANASEGIRRIAQDFTRDSDIGLAFDESNQPTVTLVEATRTGQGGARLLEPRKRYGPTYVQDVELIPPLNTDEILDLTMSARVPSYKFAYRDDLLLATADTPLGPRTYDYSLRNVSYPTGLLTMRVFLPHELGAVPAGPRTGRAASFDQAATTALVTDGCYREWDDEVGGRPGLFMELKVPNPRLHRRYRVCWTLPPRPPPACVRLSCV